MKKIASLILILSGVFIGNSQTAKKPKLVIGIVVDQMRYDYLLRFKDKFGNKGFNRLINKGTNFENAHYNYIPTYTAVGHSSVYTGTTPKNHGIISNSWYDKFQKKTVYVVDDRNYNTIGSETNTGRKSPKRLIASTIADQLKLAQNFNGKVFGVAIKDRSAILPVGHTPNMAFWFDGGKEGKWISSTYYGKELPSWVKNYNTNNKTTLDSYLRAQWFTQKDIKTYSESSDDDRSYERKFGKSKKPIFPHIIDPSFGKSKNYTVLKNTPHGNALTLDFAKAIIKNEKLGTNELYSDFLAVSLSSTDYIGHQFGPASKEIEDTYLHLNDKLEEFITYLDNVVGKKEYVLFLTADHAVVHIPHHLIKNKLPGGYLNRKEFSQQLNKFILEKYHTDKLIENISNNQIFLNHQLLKKLNLSSETVENEIIDEIINYPMIYKAISAHTLQKAEFQYAPLSLLQQGYNQKRSGDIMVTLNPSVISGDIKTSKGTTHGSGYNYDTHIPIIFYGANINKGKSVKNPVKIIQIAPTVSNILQIQEPNMSSHDILTEVFKTYKQ